MPQMNPLPWVSVWGVVLGLVMVYMTLVYFSLISFKKSEQKGKAGVDYYWMW